MTSNGPINQPAGVRRSAPVMPDVPVGAADVASAVQVVPQSAPVSAVAGGVDAIQMGPILPLPGGSTFIPRAEKLSDAMKALGRYIKGGNGDVSKRMASAVELLLAGAKFGADRADGFRGVTPTNYIEEVLDPYLAQFGFPFYPKVLSEIFEYVALASANTGLDAGDIRTAMSRVVDEVFTGLSLSPFGREDQLVFVTKQLARANAGASIDDLVNMIRERVTIVDANTEKYTCNIMPTGRPEYGVLAAGAAPGGGYFLANSDACKVKIGSAGIDLDTLKNAGLNAIVCLLEKNFEEEKALAEARGIKWLALAINDFQTPTFEQADPLIRAIIAELEAGRNVLVHCAAGRGRTGTINACVLIRLGVDPSVAIAVIRRERPGSIETPEQERFIYQYAARVAGETSGNL
jgi:atypical dual specificity phosphatase